MRPRGAQEPTKPAEYARPAAKGMPDSAFPTTSSGRTGVQWSQTGFLCSGRNMPRIPAILILCLMSFRADASPERESYQVIGRDPPKRWTSISQHCAGGVPARCRHTLQRQGPGCKGRPIQAQGHSCRHLCAHRSLPRIGERRKTIEVGSQLRGLQRQGYGRHRDRWHSCTGKRPCRFDGRTLRPGHGQGGILQGPCCPGAPGHRWYEHT